MTTIKFYDTIKDFQVNLLAYAIKLTGNTHDAHDLVQETFYKALKNRNKLTHDKNLYGWLLTIMKNTFTNNYRRNLKYQDYIAKTQAYYFLNTPPHSGFNSPDQAYSIQEINTALKQLPDPLIQPITLFITGYKYKEIAEQLSLPLGTVKSKIHQARQLLMRLIHEYHPA